MPAPAASGRLPELDALRGLAALLVVVFHCATVNPAGASPALVGTAGVDLFFIISGFVIFLSLHRVSTGTEFVRNRISRLYPGYWAAVTFTYCLLALNPLRHLPPPGWPAYAANLTMVQQLLGVPDLDGPYWTLLIELLFYALMLLLYKAALLKHVHLLGVGLVASSVLVITQLSGTAWVAALIHWVPLVQYLPLFLAGICFYQLYCSRPQPISYYALAACYIFCQYLLFWYVGRSRHYTSQHNYGIMLALFYLAFTLVVHNQLAFLVNRVTLFLGKISYALYLIHQYLSTKLLIPFLLTRYHVKFWVAAFGAALPVSLVLATLITYGIEIPVGRYLKRKLTFG